MAVWGFSGCLGGFLVVLGVVVSWGAVAVWGFCCFFLVGGVLVCFLLFWVFAEVSGFLSSHFLWLLVGLGRFVSLFLFLNFGAVLGQALGHLVVFHFFCC